MTNRFSRVQIESNRPQFTVAHSSGKVPYTEKEGDFFEINIINIPSATDYDRVRYLERIQNGVANLLNDIFYGAAKNQERRPILNFNTDGFWTRKRLLRLLECRRNNSVPNDAKILDGFVRVETEQAGEQGWVFDKEAIQQQYSIAERLSEWQELYNITRAQIEKLMEKSRDKVAEKSDVPEYKFVNHLRRPTWEERKAIWDAQDKKPFVETEQQTSTWMEQQEREVNALNKKQQEEFWWGTDAIKSQDIIKVCHLVFAGEECVVYAKARPEIIKEFREKLKDLFVYSTPAADSEKRSPSAPRWKTEDGQMTNWPMVLFWVNTNTFETGETHKVEIGWEPLPNMAFKYFADRDKRDQWVKENRPRFSLMQLEKMAESSHGLIGAFLSDIRKQSKS